LQPLDEKWTSPVTHATYSIQWKVAVPKLGLELQANTPLASQELAGAAKVSPNYWEGAIALIGVRNAKPLSGVGYLEMTGYDRPVQLAP
jgi:predicted secreted hydrolase